MTPEVQSFLEERGARFFVHRHAPVATFEQARRVLPFDPASVVKCLAFRLPGGRIGLAALRALDRADYKKVSDAFGVRRADLSLASGEEVADELGMMPGGIAPCRSTAHQ